MQSNNMDPTLATNLGSPNGKGNRTQQYADYGFEVGGPIIKDRLWGWGSMGKTDVRIVTIRQTPDRTILKNRGFKLTGQVTQDLRAGFTYFFADKNKFGRSASATRPPATTLDQKGPSKFSKFEANYVVGNNLFLTVRGAHFPTGFRLDPEGGLDAQITQDETGTWHGSYWNYVSDRPQNTVMAEGSFFKGNHEVKFGYSWRRTTVDSSSQTPGNQIVSYYDGYPNIIADVASYWASAATAHYKSAWVGDTMTMDRATINAGVRFDWQDDGTLAVSEPAVPGFEQWLPAIQSTAVPGAVKWNSASPRLAVTYALDESHKTLLRGSYALFASQLANGKSGQISVVQYRMIEFSATDTNGNGYADPTEINQNDILHWTGFNINNPGDLSTPINTIHDYKVPKTHELVVGVDHELMPNFGLSASFTYRRMVDFNWNPRIGVRRPDYVQVGTLTGDGLPDGSSYSAPYYAVDTSMVGDAALAGGTELTARQGYHQRYMGLEVSATKRLSNRWMARLGFSSNSHREDLRQPRHGDPGSDAGPEQPAGQRRSRGAAVGRQRQERDLPAPAEVPVHRERHVSGAARDRPGLQPAHPAGLRPAVVPEPRGDGRPLRHQQERAPHQRRREEPAADGDDARLPAREGDSREPREHQRGPGHLQPVQLGHDPRPPVRQAADGRDRVRPGAGDHEPADHAHRPARELLNTTMGAGAAGSRPHSLPSHPHDRRPHTGRHPHHEAHEDHEEAALRRVVRRRAQGGAAPRYWPGAQPGLTAPAAR